jgi:hypothetical protein
MNKVVVLVMAIAVALLFIGANVETAPVKADKVDGKVILLQETPSTTEAGEGDETKEEGKEGKKEEEEEELEELDYELGKVDPKTKKAVRYVCKGCGEVQLEPFKCDICEKDAEKEELDVEERNGKWFIKGTNTQVVEKEPEEEEEAESETKKEGK